jgi:hypothetical protein
LKSFFETVKNPDPEPVEGSFSGLFLYPCVPSTGSGTGVAFLFNRALKEWRKHCGGNPCLKTRWKRANTRFAPTGKIADYGFENVQQVI